MERTLDAKGRWRNRTVGFRVSEEEAKMIDCMVALSGLTKQEYILRKLMDWEVDCAGKSESVQSSEKSDAADLRGTETVGSM